LVRGSSVIEIKWVNSQHKFSSSASSATTASAKAAASAAAESAKATAAAECSAAKAITAATPKTITTEASAAAAALGILETLVRKVSSRPVLSLAVQIAGPTSSTGSIEATTGTLRAAFSRPIGAARFG
jgi:hypothetical protein